MFCQKCGTEGAEGTFCQKCGEKIGVTPNQVNNAYQQPVYNQQGVYSQGVAVPTGTSSLVLGIISMITWIIPIAGFPTSIVGLVLGVKAKNRGARGKVTVGIVLSIIALVLTAINSFLGGIIGAIQGYNYY